MDPHQPSKPLDLIPSDVALTFVSRGATADVVVESALTTAAGDGSLGESSDAWLSRFCLYEFNHRLLLLRLRVQSFSVQTGQQSRLCLPQDL